MRISDWSSDVGSSDLSASDGFRNRETPAQVRRAWWLCPCPSRTARSAPCGSARRRPAPFRHGKGAPRHAKDTPASAADDAGQIGRAHVCTPVTKAHLVCHLLLEKKKTPFATPIYPPHKTFRTPLLENEHNR